MIQVCKRSENDLRLLFQSCHLSRSLELWHLLSTSGFPSLLVCCPSRLGGGFASPQLRRELYLRDTTWRHAWRIVCRSSGFWCMMTRATWQLWRRPTESAQPGLRAWPMHLQSSSYLIDDFDVPGHTGHWRRGRCLPSIEANRAVPRRHY